MTINRFIKIKDMKTKNFKSLDRWGGYIGEISPEGGADKFCQWFVGFSDGESNFSIVPGYSGDKITKFSFRFTIGLHIDDKNALVYIRNLLAVGNINENTEVCKFVVSDKEGIIKLISILDKYNLNTTKYLDYTDFKEAFNLYHSRNGVLTEELKDKIIKLKSGMNSNRTNFNMPSNHIRITTYWLLGLIEGEGSFQLWRSDLVPVFSIVLTERQLPVLVKIKEFLIQNLGFDSDSIWKLNNTSAIGINTQKARNNSKGSALLIIKDIRILYNYLIPFFDELSESFLSKKAQDFKDFKVICWAVYYGIHKEERIKLLILKLSRGMNNFRLSNYAGEISAEFLTQDERDILTNASPASPTKKKLTGGAMRRMLKRNLGNSIGNKVRYYSTKSSLLSRGFVSDAPLGGGDPAGKGKLSPWWVTGFSDASEKKALVVFGTNLQSTVGEKFTRKELAMIKLPSYQRGVVIGLLLSDGWLILSNSRSKNYRLGFSQSLAHLKYTWSVFSILSPYCSSHPTYRIRERLDKISYSIEFFTRSLPCFTELQSIFYVNRVKIIPEGVYNLLTPVALAHWIMGDGVAKSHGLIICTDSYSVQDVVRLMNVLIIRYGLECTLRPHTPTQPRIYIRQRSMPLLRTIVTPHMDLSMLYKLG
jgi:LAGLIDADG DNA endonuclease family/LAGLIDADG endonuclease